MRGEDGGIRLPKPQLHGILALEEALGCRRSVREFAPRPIPLAALGQILWATQGITHPEGFRTAPSAGALYPLEVYAVVGRVTDLAPGVYVYRPHAHTIVRVAEGDRRDALCQAALDQTFIRDAAVVLVIAAVYERTTWKYTRRGVRYVHFEVGHAAQNALLQCVALGLGAVVVGAFDDASVQTLTGMQPNESPLYLIAIGIPETPRGGKRP